MSVLAMKATLEVQQEVFLSVYLCLHTKCSLIAKSLNTDCKKCLHTVCNLLTACQHLNQIKAEQLTRTFEVLVEILYIF